MVARYLAPRRRPPRSTASRAPGSTRRARRRPRRARPRRRCAARSCRAAGAGGCPTRCACSRRCSLCARAGRRPPRNLVVVREARRHAGAREGREDHLPRRLRGRWARRARTASSPTARAGAGRWTSSPFTTVIALSGLVDRRVDVHAEDQLAARDVLQLVDERAVAVLRGDALPLEQAERVGAGGGEPAAFLARDLRDVRAQRPQLLRRPRPPCGTPDVVISSTDCISSGLIRASNSPSSVTRASIESMCCTRSHVSGSSSMYSSSTPRVYGSPLPNAVIEDAGFGHGWTITASASISTRQRGSSRPVTTPVVAGRARANASLWARPTSSMSSARVT